MGIGNIVAFLDIIQQRVEFKLAIDHAVEIGARKRDFGMTLAANGVQLSADQLDLLLTSVVAMFALAIFPPYFSPGAEAIQTVLKDDPASLGLVVLLGDISYYGPITDRYEDVFVRPLRPLPRRRRMTNVSA